MAHLLALALLTGAASAQSTATCELYCTDLANQRDLACDGDLVCLEELDEGFDACLGGCPVVVDVPKVPELVDLGLQAAEHLLDQPVHLVEDQVYLHPDGADGSVLVVVSTDPTVTAADVRDQIADGVDPVQWDGSLAGLEISARVEQPPVVAWWTGVPYEYVVDELFAPHALATYGTDRFTLVGRHGTPVFPVFEYDVDGVRVYFDPRRGAITEHIVAHVNEPLRKSDDWLLHVERAKRDWVSFLDGSWFTPAPEAK